MKNNGCVSPRFLPTLAETTKTMKILSLILALLLGSLLNVHANLGDSYVVSSQKYGRSRGAAPNDMLGTYNTSAGFHFNGYTIYCVFHGDYYFPAGSPWWTDRTYCVAIMYKKDSGGISDAEAKQLLENNRGANVVRQGDDFIILGTDEYLKAMQGNVKGL
jgi:hypothetical protein